MYHLPYRTESQGVGGVLSIAETAHIIQYSVIQ